MALRKDQIPGMGTLPPPTEEERQGFRDAIREKAGITGQQLAENGAAAMVSEAAGVPAEGEESIESLAARRFELTQEAARLEDERTALSQEIAALKQPFLDQADEATRSQQADLGLKNVAIAAITEDVKVVDAKLLDYGKRLRTDTLSAGPWEVVLTRGRATYDSLTSTVQSLILSLKAKMPEPLFASIFSTLYKLDKRKADGCALFRPELDEIVEASTKASVTVQVTRKELIPIHKADKIVPDGARSVAFEIAQEGN